MVSLSFSEKVKKPIFLFGIPCLFFILVSLFFLLTSNHAIYDFPMDDAWIHRVYARSLAWGQGLSYNTGEQETGATSPLWVLLTAPVHWFEPRWPNAPVVGVKFIGGLLGMMTIALVALITQKLTGGVKVPLMAASIWAVEPRLIFSSYSGMEVNLFVVLLLGILLADWAEKKTWAYLLLSLLPVCRPEGLLVLLLYGLRDFMLMFKRPKTFKVLAWLLIPLPFLLWMGICYGISGLVLPLPFYQKTQWVLPNFSLLNKMWQLQSHHGLYPGLVFALGLILFGLFCLRPGYSLGRSAILHFIGFPVVLLFGIVSSRSISLSGYYWLRYVDPADFLLMITATIGLAVWASQIGQWRFWIRKISKEDKKLWLLIKGNLPLMAGILLIVSLPHWWQSMELKRYHLSNDGRIIHLMNVEVGRWLKANTSPNVSVGVNDAGAIRYFSQRRVIDLLGLNNKAVALRRVPLKELFNQVDWVALYPVWFRQYNLKTYDLRRVFAVNFEDYSICNCPTQTLVAIAERRR